ncbi:MAG: hypothetical protein ABL949_02525 [Fimbriimonadaceae bacterium]
MDPAVVKVIGICFVIMLSVVGAVIVFMLEHQRKMTRILRGEHVEESTGLVAQLVTGAGDPSQVKALEARVEQLERTVFMLQANAGNAELPTVQDRITG